MIQAEFNETKGILETILTGVITIKEIKEYYASLPSMNNLPKRLKVLIDSNNARYQFTDADLKLISESVLPLLGHFEVIIEAIIESSPYETELAFLYEKRNEMKNLRFRVFSSKDTACIWLNTF
ncbi:MAG: hypothetical protein R2750_08605 [Bacteroidales bacterium]